MTTFEAIIPLALIAIMVSPIVGLPWPSHGHRSSDLLANHLAKTLRQARELDDDQWGAFLDLGRDDPCWNYFKCLMPNADYSFLDQLLSFNMQDVLGNLSRICLGVEEPSGCAVDECEVILYNGHWYTEALIDYEILYWSCDHLTNFQAGAQCWADPFNTRMSECLESNPNPIESESTGCLSTVPESLEACTEGDAQFLADSYRHMMQVMLDVQDRIRLNYD